MRIIGIVFDLFLSALKLLLKLILGIFTIVMDIAKLILKLFSIVLKIFLHKSLFLTI